MSHASEKVRAAIRVVEHPDGGFVIRIGADAMLELMETFEAEKSYSNGPAWGGLIDFIVSSDPRMSDYELDDEGRGWSRNREPLDRLRDILLEAAAEPDKLRALIRAGRAAGFGHGEL